MHKSFPIFKFLLDRIVAFFLLLLSLPLLATILLMVYVSDFSFPIFISSRVGRYSKPFPLFKVRTMKPLSHLIPVDSTSYNDPRVTPLGRVIRSFKFDEIPQLFNVLVATMSFVGPRPNTFRNGVEFYTDQELRLLSVLPGITDLSSVVFADEAEILYGSANPDNDYNLLIRPWKSRLSLWHLDHSSFAFDLFILFVTLVSSFRRRFALKLINAVLVRVFHENRFTPIVLRTSPIDHFIVEPP